MSSNLKNIDYLQVANSLYISDDLKDSIKIAFDPLSVINLTRFRESVQRYMNYIECTPTKAESPTIDEVRSFLDEELPSKLRSNKRPQHKELHRMNSTIMPNIKDITTTVNASSQLVTATTSSNCSNDSTVKLFSSLKTSFEIYGTYKNFMTKLDELLKEKLDKDNIKVKFADNNIALEKMKKFAKDLEELGNVNKENDSRDAFTLNQEENICKIGNSISQYVYIQENKELYTNFESIGEIDNNENLDILINAVNDLLHEITLIT